MAGSDRGAPRAARDLLVRAKALDAELAGAGVRRRAAAPVPPPAAAIIDSMAQFDAVITDPDLRSVTRALFRDGYYARAVEEGFKFLNNAVKGRANDSTTRDGQALMNHVFSSDSPVLKLSRMRSESQKNEQAGYRMIFAGAMTGIRNPRAHEHDLRDEADAALEMLVLANHLMRALRRTTRVRRRRARPTTNSPAA